MNRALRRHRAKKLMRKRARLLRTLAPDMPIPDGAFRKGHRADGGCWNKRCPLCQSKQNKDRPRQKRYIPDAA